MWVVEAGHGTFPFREVFDVLGNRCHRCGKGFQGEERTMCKGMGSWWRDKYIYRLGTVPMLTKCWRVLSHVHSLNGSINWPWSAAMIDKVRAWQAKILRLTFRPRLKPGETWVGKRKKDCTIVTNELEEDGFAAADRKN